MLVSSLFIHFFILCLFLLFFCLPFLQCCPILITSIYRAAIKKTPKFLFQHLGRRALVMLAVIFAPISSTSTNPMNSLSKNVLNVKHAITTTNVINTMESELVVPHKDADRDGWLEVGKRNWMVVTCTVCEPFYGSHCPIFPSFHPCIFLFFHLFLLAIYTDKRYRIPNNPDIGGKFCSTLHTPGQKDLVLVEDWNSLRLDIQVSFCFCFALLFFYMDMISN